MIWGTSVLAAVALFLAVSATTQGGILSPAVFAACNGSGESHTDITQEPNVESAVADMPLTELDSQTTT